MKKLIFLLTSIKKYLIKEYDDDIKETARHFYELGLNEKPEIR